MNPEQRLDPRLDITLPVKLADGATGSTRDVSVSGLFLEIDTQQEVGNSVALEVDISLPTGNFKLKTEGVIVRIEPSGQRTGIAIKLINSQLQAID